MTFDAVLDVQDVMFRAYVRNLMFFATLPYYVTQQIQRHLPMDDGAAGAAESPSVIYLERYRNVRIGNGS